MTQEKKKVGALGVELVIASAPVGGQIPTRVSRPAEVKTVPLRDAAEALLPRLIKLNIWGCGGETGLDGGRVSCRGCLDWVWWRGS